MSRRNTAWDPSSIDEKYCASKKYVFKIKEGRDGRKWVCVRSTEDSEYYWKLHKDEKKMVRRENPYELKKEMRPLATQAWWVYSRISRLEAFYLYDCARNGNCMFSSLSNGLCYAFDHLTQREYSAEKIRALAASMITERNVDAFLEKEMADRSADPSQKYRWDVHDVAATKDVELKIAKVRSVMEQRGNTYWGDTTTLELLCAHPKFKKLNVGFIILQPNATVYPRIISSWSSESSSSSFSSSTSSSSSSFPSRSSSSSSSSSSLSSKSKHAKKNFEKKQKTRAQQAQKTQTKQAEKYIMILYNTKTHWQLVVEEQQVLVSALADAVEQTAEKRKHGPAAG